MEKEKVESFYDDMSKEYKKTHSNRFVDLIFEHFINENIIQKNNLKILDAGGGIGRFSFPFAEKGHEVTLTEISEGMLDTAKAIATEKKLNVKLFKESVIDMKNQEDNYYDVVFLMNGILDYCQNHKKTLSEVKRVLKKDGILIGTVNNKFKYAIGDELLVKKDVKLFRKHFDSGNYGDSFPIHDFSLNEIKSELENFFYLNKIFGPTNLLRKWEYDSIINENTKEEFLKLQIEFAEKKEFILNSNDFMFVCINN